MGFGVFRLGFYLLLASGIGFSGWNWFLGHGGFTTANLLVNRPILRVKLKKNVNFKLFFFNAKRPPRKFFCQVVDIVWTWTLHVKDWKRHRRILIQNTQTPQKSTD